MEDSNSCDLATASGKGGTSTSCNTLTIVSLKSEGQSFGRQIVCHAQIGLKDLLPCCMTRGLNVTNVLGCWGGKDGMCLCGLERKDEQGDKKGRNRSGRQRKQG